MTKIQYGPGPDVIRIGSNNACLDASCPTDDLCPAGWAECLIEVLEIFKQGGVANHRGLHNFCNTASELRRRKRFESYNVGDDGGWLPNHPDEILAFRAVNACLAADCSIHHAEQRCRHRNPPHAAHKCGGSKPRSGEPTA